MIQRIQSVYLIGVVIFSLVMFFVPFGSIDAYVLTAMELRNGEELLKTTYPLAGTVGLGALLALVTLFLYKNRKLQIKLCTLSMIVQAVIVALALFVYLDPTAAELGVEKASYQLGTFLPIGGMVLSFLASKAIKKDDDLIRSVDRIR